MPTGEKNRFGNSQKVIPPGTHPIGNVTVKRIPNYCSCTWDAHGIHFPNVRWTLKYRHAICQAYTRGEHL